MERCDDNDIQYQDGNEYAVNQIDINLIDTDFDEIDPFGEIYDDNFGINDTKYEL